MHAPADVLARILASVGPLEATRRPVAGCAGLVLAEAVAAVADVPPFASSAMDGYALRADDVATAAPDAPVRLEVLGEVRAGRPGPARVLPGGAVRIMTGAVVPDGADAVVMVERTSPDAPDGVLVSHAANPGEHVRPAGGDVRAGDAVFPVGTVLSASHLGVLASLGLDEVRVVRRVRVGVCSTGDELVEGAGRLAPGEIHDSNRPMLAALCAEAGCEVVDLGIARDDERSVRALFERALASCDAVVTSGGVSMGEYDYVKAVLDELGVLQWFQIAIRPAKPLAFGVVRGVPVFGLPGNPVSSHVSFELFARPALRSMMGVPSPCRAVLVAEAAHDFDRGPDGKLHLDRVRLDVGADGHLRASRSGVQASNVLSGLAGADGLALVPDGPGIEAGAPVRVIVLRPLDAAAPS